MRQRVCIWAGMMMAFALLLMVPAPATAATLPGIPAGVTATPGDGKATVAFTAPDSGASAIISYTVTAAPGGVTAYGASSPITVTGLINGIPYTFRVAATNSTGTGLLSTPSNSVIPSALPSAPTSVKAAPAGDGEVSISFSLPADNGGSTITSYSVTSSPGNQRTTGNASPIKVSGLTLGTSYTFTVTATNAAGDGPASAASNGVIPVTMPGAPTRIGAVPGNGQATITFTPPTNGYSSKITSYSVTSSPGGIQVTGTDSPIVVTGLANGTSYSFTVIAINAIGNGPPSTQSAMVTPSAEPAATLTSANGPTGTLWQGIAQDVPAFVIDPTNPQTVYAGTSSRGVFKSNNGGASWREINSGLTSLAIHALVIDPASSQTIYAGTDYGIFKSTNGGASWGSAPSALSETYVNALAIDPASSQTIYARTDARTLGLPNVVYKSTNGGITWSAVYTGGPTNVTRVSVLAVDPGNGQTIYAGTSGSGVLKSTNGGTSWSALNSSLPNANVYLLTIDPANRQTIYAGTKSGVYKSINGGTSWTAVNSGFIGTNYPVRSLALDPANGQILYAEVEHRLYKSTNGGASWSVSDSGLGGTAYSLAIDPSNSQTIYAGTVSSGGVFKSTNGGTSWSATNNGSAYTYVNAVAIDPTRSGTIYAGTEKYGGVIFKSTNGGTSWSAVNDDYPYGVVRALAIDPADSQTVYVGAFGGVAKSSNGGTSWSLLYNSWTTTNTVHSLAIDRNSHQTIYAGMSGSIIKSTNGGTSWGYAQSGLSPYAPVRSLVIDPADSQTVYAGTDGYGVYKSTDGGTSWNAVNNGLADPKVRSLAIDPANSQAVYAGTSSCVYKSTDGGISWNSADKGFTSSNVLSLVIDPANSQTIYGGASSGIFKSTDGGTSWRALGSNFNIVNVRSLALNPFDSRIIYAGTDSGVFKSISSFQLAIVSVGTGMGRVTPVQNGTSSGALDWYSPGYTVTLAASPAAGSRFAGWSGCDAINGTSCSVTMDSDRNVSATFTPASYVVTPSAGPGGSIDPAAKTIPYGASASFSVKPDPGFRTGVVSGCSGALSGGTYTTGPIGTDCTVQATFIPTLTGTVWDLSTGKPIAAAAVTIPGGATTQTDADGYFVFATPPSAPATYNVSIGKNGYGSITIQGVALSNTSGGTIRAGLVPASNAPLNFSSAPALPPASKGTVYSAPVSITGGSGPYTFSRAYGSLPDGLTLDSALGVIGGTATVIKSFTFGIAVTDSLGNYAEREFTIDVTAPLKIANVTLPRGMSAAEYSAAFDVSGGAPSYYFSLFSGELPQGLTLEGARLKGKITASPGVYNFAIKVIDSEGRVFAQPYALSVDPLFAATSRLNDAIVGTAYSQPITATGGLAPYAWSLYAGNLPAGLALDPATGIIAGTPIAAASEQLTIKVADSFGRSVYQAYALRVLNPLQIPTTVLPNSFVGASYSELVRVTGGIAPYSFSISGQLPAGLQIDHSTGVVSGVPSVGGFTNVYITVTDSTWAASQTRTVTMGIRVWSQLTITSTSIIPNARRGVAITPVTLAARGGTSPYSWSVVAKQNGTSRLPQGITLDPLTGVLSGTPTEWGDFTFTVGVTDASGQPVTAEKQFYLHVSIPLKVDTKTVPTGAAGVQYSAILSATGGLKNYSWIVKDGTLPSGLALDQNSGAISGTPSAKINSSVTFEVTDSDVPPQSAQQSLVFEVSDTLAISETSLPNGRQGQAYLANVRALLGTPGYGWQVAVAGGSLPPGVTLQQNAGIASLQGTPTTPGSYSFTLEVNDSSAVAQKASRQFTVVIYEPVTITTTALKNAQRGKAYSQAVLAKGGIAPYIWQVVVGNLPQGLELNPTTGEIGGTTDAAIGYTASFRVRVTDGGSPAASVAQDYTIQAIDPMTITTPGIPVAQQYAPYSVTFDGSGGIAPQKWAIVSGSLPSGVVLNISTGVMSGTPAVCGSFPFTIGLADASLAPTTVQAAFTLAVTCAGTAPPTLTVSLSGTGSGSVNSAPSGISCTSGTCSAYYSSGTVVSLFQAESQGARFAGWGGACSGMGDCSVTVNAAKSVTATFNKVPKTLIGSAGYDSLSLAYAAAASPPGGSTIIMSLAGELVESPVLNLGKYVVFKGGYNQDYVSRSGMTTTLLGTLSIRSGKVTVDKLTIKKP